MIPILLASLGIFLYSNSPINDTEIKPCRNYCCENILFFVVKDINNEELVTTQHGSDCVILNGTRSSKIRAIIKNRKNDDVLCWLCNGEQLNYDKECGSWCCKHYGFVVDFRTGLIHYLNCDMIKDMPIYDAMFKPKRFDLIDGYKKLDYSGLCLFCLGGFARLN